MATGDEDVGEGIETVHDEHFDRVAMFRANFELELLAQLAD